MIQLRSLLIFSVLRVGLAFRNLNAVRPITRSSNGNSFFTLKSYRIDNYDFEGIDIPIPGLPNPVRILEATANSQDELVEEAIEAEPLSLKADPYGSVLWPAAYSVSLRILQLDRLSSFSVLELGTGTGLVSIVAALGGARRVLATDYSPLTCRIVTAASGLQSSPITTLSTAMFDIKDLSTPLPAADLVVAADLMYDASLGVALASRVLEAVERGSHVIVGDSPLRPGRKYFLEEIEKACQKNEVLFAKLKGAKFYPVIGKTVSGFRHDLISTKNTVAPQDTTVDIFEVL